jgi:hypothetical protein
MPAPRIRVSAIALALSLAAAPTAAQGFTISGPDSSRLTFNGRIQTQFNTSSEDGVPEAETALRRVRLEATLQLNRLVSGKISPEFAGSRVSIRDAYVRFALDPALVVWAGQAYRPFSIMTMYSSARMLPIERGVRIRGLSDEFDEFNLVSSLGYGDRDVGLQLRGEPAGAPLGLSYAAGWFNGPARAEFPNENTGQVVARVGVAPAPNLKLNASYSARDFATGEDAVEVRRGEAWEADVEIGSERGGLHLLGEVVAGDFDPFLGARFLAAQGWLGYRMGRVSRTISGVEPMFRVSYAEINANDTPPEGLDASGGMLITPGVNLWLGGLNRFSLNYDIWDSQTGESAQSFKAQFQLAF